MLIACAPLLAQEECDLFKIQELSDAYLNFQVDTIIRLSEGTFEVQLSNGNTFTQIVGCSDPAYVEYDPSANTDDGSCTILVVLGCTDFGYIEFNPEANTDDGSCFTNSCSSIEYHGYTYSLAEIGDQCWFAENLRTTVYENGSGIPEITNGYEWGLNSKGWCNYNNDVGNLATYGRLYNWAAVNGGNLCPAGWHVPTDGEWSTLMNYITSQGFNGTEGTALKSTSGWLGSGNGTDDFGFSALPGGQRWPSLGEFTDAGSVGIWWSSSFGCDIDWYSDWFPDHIPYYVIGSNFSRWCAHPGNGFSVRCLRDAN